ncbi:hypothetical protein ACRARG_07485 [Pseudooceanicola sp. C21-150M6]|uniref:hypothetical protein n=1 Tax=Pseudooceanicola sp. C21-150M6 TaxID=3434355 RepID=UPI003D7F5537
MIRTILSAFLLVAVAACTNSRDLGEPPVDLGNFRLGHNIVVTSKMRQAGLSRDATEEEWHAAMTDAIAERFGRYEGDRLYHLGVSVEGFSIAPPGVPIVVSPKSILIIRATVWDDALGKKLNEQAKQFTVFESFSGDTLVGSGLTKTKQEQMVNLSRNAAKQIQNWLVANPDWFPGIGEAPEASAAAAAVTGAGTEEASTSDDALAESLAAAPSDSGDEAASGTGTEGAAETSAETRLPVVPGAADSAADPVVEELEAGVLEEAES